MEIKHKIKKGQTITLPIKRLGINGEGIGYFKKTIVFVPGALPTETVTAKVTEIAPRFVEAELVKINTLAKDRIEPPCDVYDECGGCQLQHLAYDSQLAFKTDVVKQAMAKYKPENFESYSYKPTIGMENPWRYRNKLQFQIRKNKADKVQAGLYKADSHDLIAIDDCLVQQPATMTVLNTIVSLLEEYGVPIYDEKNNSGIVKTIMVREGLATGEVQVVFITNSPKLPKKQALIAAIQEQLPQVVSVMQNIQNKKTSLVMGDETVHLWGKESIEEHLEDLVFDLSARAFFQLNPEQTALLYREARKALNPQPNQKIIDAYCGVGTIGLSVAKNVKEVRGMDTIPAAIDDAKLNAERLGLKNTRYEVGTAEELLPSWLRSGFKPDGIVVDPPRTGLDHDLINALITYPTETLVYVSCNPSTLARDLVKLSQRYQVEYLQSVDMFPQTARAEVVAKLVLKRKGS
ncbi:23S rRNA (uracil(1939)-C(5))-methyltransferase RlmD [Vagococcus coleopterorum]|uniref:23S rRNA (Uracil(1939)-C(5))-methyltransferase RlmD n=1 Tax=Vagococcus coleopterorum TaxID=2714946 RepID=A0A6G8AL00_9ENTE|nr:23S rRNA (uracil(1939)-C(5))-methyltransferase RlmD [Vagococcus coleopterorum]QIL45639.1 23S rRNA (uracil(1939)-C(5))-methyltransferase RlmD [Vagococcus coleopterorum]